MGRAALGWVQPCAARAVLAEIGVVQLLFPVGLETRREDMRRVGRSAFAVGVLGVIVPLQGVDDNAKNQCEVAPCAISNAHTTITFTFRTGKKGHYRWQCFVPCAAGFLYGFGGPMPTNGCMEGFGHVG